MRGYQQANKIHEPKDTRLQASTHQPEDMEDAGMEARAHEPEDMRM